MKKIIFCFLMALITFSVYSLAENFCVYPDNSEIAEYIEKYFGVESSTSKVDINPEAVYSGDYRTLEYICKNSDVDFLIIPSISDLSGFNFFQLWIFDLKSKRFELVYENISQSENFSEDVIKALKPYFSEKMVVLENSKKQEDKSSDIFNDLLINSTPSADVYLEGKKIGTTPLTLKEYNLPLFVRFSSEGYSDYYFTLEKEVDSISVSLIPLNDLAEEQYLDARNRFYGSFGTMLLSFGVKAAIPTFISRSSSLYKPLDYASDGLIGALAINSVFKLVKYYKSAKQVSP